MLLKGQLTPIELRRNFKLIVRKIRSVTPRRLKGLLINELNKMQCGTLFVNDLSIDLEPFGPKYITINQEILTISGKEIFSCLLPQVFQ